MKIKKKKIFILWLRKGSSRKRLTIVMKYLSNQPFNQPHDDEDDDYNEDPQPRSKILNKK